MGQRDGEAHSLGRAVRELEEVERSRYRKSLPATLPVLAGECPFCPEGLTGRVVARHGETVVVENLYPYAEVSELVIPSREHTWAWHTASSDDVVGVAEVVWVRHAIQSQRVPRLSCWCSWGRIAGQTQPHFHVQLAGPVPGAGPCRSHEPGTGLTPEVLDVRGRVTISARPMPEIQGVDIVCAATGLLPDVALHAELHLAANRAVRAWQAAHGLQGYNVTDHGFGDAPHVHVTIRNGAQAAVALHEGWELVEDPSKIRAFASELAQTA